ncbi:hypothetical protein F2Q69_00048379 [Brassica cretica]|uniref:Uncharacterized protein n=1 Tax=Brassica cretica TaxID=69181 RepID=A0A8S9PU59_BRACR|nr:hypothetical protein F2Q69_00048379 [Brassica cretica]
MARGNGSGQRGPAVATTSSGGAWSTSVWAAKLQAACAASAGLQQLLIMANGGDEGSVVTVCGGSGGDLRWLCYKGFPLSS